MGDSVKSLEKMFDILECFSMEMGTQTITGIQSATGLPKSTIFRILSTMEKRKYIHKNEESQKYELGFKFFYLGSIVQNAFNLRRAALPVMKKLVEATDETVELNILENGKRICIEKVDSPQTVRNFVRIGEQHDVHQGASGKILFAYASDVVRKEIIEHLNFSAAEKMRMENELFLIKEKGFTVSREERMKGSFSIAAPIRDYSENAVAGLTIAGPIQRLNGEQEERMVRHIVTAAYEISERMGYCKNTGETPQTVKI